MYHACEIKTSAHFSMRTFLLGGRGDVWGECAVYKKRSSPHTNNRSGQV